METGQSAGKIKILNWLLIVTAAIYLLGWVIFPNFMSQNGGAFLILGVFNTVLLLKLLSFNKAGWNTNFLHIRRSLPWLIYIALMGITIHYFLEVTYYAPRRDNAIRAIKTSMDVEEEGK